MYEVLVRSLSVPDAVAYTRHSKICVRTVYRKLKGVADHFGYDCVDQIPSPVRTTIDREFLRAFASAGKDGRKMYLSKHEEFALAGILYCLSMDGHSVTFSLLQMWMTKLLPMWNPSVPYLTVTTGWFYGFLKRHPYLQQRSGKILDISRKAGESNILPFFEMVRAIENFVGDMTDFDPDLVANGDETMCQRKTPHFKVIGSSMSNCVSRCGSETERPHISLLPIVCANGSIIHSLIIQESASLNLLYHGNNEGFSFAATLNGFITAESFFEYVRTDLIEAINQHRDRLGKSGRRFVLILDGHAAHHCFPAITLFHEANIVLLFMPAHTSHLIQPLDRGFFHVFKKRFGKAMFQAETTGGAVNLTRRMDLIMDTVNCIEPRIVKGCFKHSGWHPFSPNRWRDQCEKKHVPTRLLETSEVSAFLAQQSLPNTVVPVAGADLVCTLQTPKGKITTSFLPDPSGVLMRAADDIRQVANGFSANERRARKRSSPFKGAYSNSSIYLDDRRTSAVSKFVAQKKMTELVRILKDRPEYSDLLKDTNGKRRKVADMRAQIIAFTEDRFSDLFHLSYEQILARVESVPNTRVEAPVMEVDPEDESLEDEDLASHE